MNAAVKTPALPVAQTAAMDSRAEKKPQPPSPAVDENHSAESADIEQSAGSVVTDSPDLASSTSLDPVCSASQPADPSLFPKKLPRLGATVFPIRFLGHWFSRRFNVFPRKWEDDAGGADDTGDADDGAGADLASSRMKSSRFGSGRRLVAGDSEAEATVVLADLVFGESPRFRPLEHALYFSDMFGKQVVRVDLATGARRVVYEDARDFVSGLGWLPDGRMLVVSMKKRAVLVHDAETEQTTQYADVSAVTQARANDLVVSATGRAYVGNFGFLVEDLAASCTTTLVSVGPDDRRVRVEARGLMFPNGAVVTPDGSTLIVAETFDGLLTAFTIRADDGRLANRRVWAKLGVPVDGICLDAEGCVWASVPQVGLYETGGGLLRVREGGAVVAMLGFGRNGVRNGVFACQLATDAATGEHALYFMEAPSCKESDIFGGGGGGDGEQHKKKARRTKAKRERQPPPGSSARGLSSPRPTRRGVLKRIPVRVGPARMAGNDKYSGGYC